MSSRQVALSAAFLALAAGGTAACDASPDEDTYDTVYSSDSGGYDPVPYDPGGSGSSDDKEESGKDEEAGEEVFYCADEDGEIVDEEECDTSGGTSSYFLWHSTGYSRGLRPGTTLDGGESFPAGDRKSRRAFGLPAAGQVGNGTVKTNVVGRGSGSSGISSGTSGG
jgi:hypothetical protein